MKIKHIALGLLLAIGSLGSSAQECDIELSVAGITDGAKVPSGVNTRLEGAITRALGSAGMTGAGYDAQFFVAGRFDDAYNDIISGPSQKVVVKTTLTLFIGDAQSQKIFASKSFDLKGVGVSDEQAYTRALSQLNGRNKELMDFLHQGKQRIVDYYDANYSRILNDARKAMAARDYGQALFFATTIPSCCRGYAQAQNLAMQIYGQQADFQGQQLLARAKAAWAADPTADGAELAHQYLVQIDPDAACYAQAAALSKQISQTTQKQWEFENVTKYKDQMALEQRRIDAAKETAVAWAKSRPKVVNRYHFIGYRVW